MRKVCTTLHQHLQMHVPEAESLIDAKASSVGQNECKIRHANEAEYQWGRIRIDVQGRPQAMH